MENERKWKIESHPHLNADYFVNGVSATFCQQRNTYENLFATPTSLAWNAIAKSWVLSLKSITLLICHYNEMMKAFRRRKISSDVNIPGKMLYANVRFIKFECLAFTLSNQNGWDNENLRTDFSSSETDIEYWFVIICMRFIYNWCSNIYNICF